MSSLVVIAGPTAAVVGVFVALAYWRGWQWTGLPAPGAAEQRAKTLWDWLQLLVIPVALASLAFLLNDAQSLRDQRREGQRAAQQRAVAADAERENTLRTYLAQMSDLVLDRRLLHSRSGADVREVARTATLIAVRRLDGPRRGLVVRFLAEANLLRREQQEEARVAMDSADLKDADLRRANLGQADLRGTDLRGANLFEATLSGAALYGADLSWADLRGAGLYGADLGEADLHGVDLRRAALGRAHLGRVELERADLRGATLRRADLFGADLRGANLGRADLFGVDLRVADLRGADLSGANLLEAVLSGVDLRGANLGRANLSGANLRRANVTGRTSEARVASISRIPVAIQLIGHRGSEPAARD